MEFILDENDAKFIILEPEKLNKDCRFRVSPDRIRGIKSTQLDISFDMQEENVVVGITINRNHALYLRSVLDAFLQETEEDDVEI